MFDLKRVSLAEEVYNFCSAGVELVANKALQALKDSDNPIISMAATNLEKFRNDPRFKELPRRKAKEAIMQWHPKRIEFIHDHCMKKFEEHIGNDVITLTDPDKTFIAKCEYVSDLSVDQAKNCGFILPENINQITATGQKLKIRPLIIRCYGVSSGNTGLQLLEGAINIMGIDSDKFSVANALVQAYVKAERNKFSEDKNVLIVPFITGFSLGGMFANIIAIKNHWGSAVFNPLGLGMPACEFVGAENWKLAKTSHQDCHVTISTTGDFTSSEISPLKHLVKIPGQVITMESQSIDPVNEHCEYRQAFAQLIDKGHFQRQA